MTYEVAEPLYNWIAIAHEWNAEAKPVVRGGQRRYSILIRMPGIAAKYGAAFQAAQKAVGPNVVLLVQYVTDQDNG